ncbi:MAG: D-glycero-beta-D-manno-heptose 1-phosphate adenylyltransferase [Bacteroidales bacterium]|nr:D-glycero-beta-D-manno-heptose 1-phosphate adenylyltransferase [Bacteroidales bacterium]
MQKLDVLNAKILDNEELRKSVTFWRLMGKKIVFTNGCFDIIHRGHIDYLSKAADLGNILIIGLNTDASVKRLKGKGRPVNDEVARAQNLAALFFIDAIILFDEDTPYNLIKKVKPDILVKGSDYKSEDIVGHDIVKENGGEVVTIDLLPGYSTTSIIQKIKDLD